MTLAIRSQEMMKDLKGIQLTLAHEGLSYVGIEKGVLNLQNEHIGVHDGKLTMSYNAVNESVASSNEVLFYLIFRAEASGSVARSIEVNSSITKAEAYKGESLDHHTISFSVDQAEVDQPILFQNDPNPFVTSTKIRFELPVSAEVEMIIHDVTGKELKRYEGYYKNGLHTIDLNETVLGNAGLYYYQLSVDNKFVDVKKMMVIK